MGIELNQIHQMDCVKGLGQLKPGSIDLAFADPPFNIGYAYDVYDDRKGYDAYLDWTRQWMRSVVDALKPTGTFWLAIGDEYAAELKLIAQNDLGLICRNWVIWYYTFGVHCNHKFTRSHAHLFYFIKDAKQFTFNDGPIRVPSARQLVYADSRANPDGRVPDDTWILRPQNLPEGFKANEDTWFFSRVCGTFKERAGWHGCQMPEQLLGRIIKACSNPGEIVLDPFGGSGTTLAVAKKLNREWVGFELSDKYAKRIQERLKPIKPGDPLDGPVDSVTSAPATPSVRPVRPRKAGSAQNGRNDNPQRLRRRADTVRRTAVTLEDPSTAIVQAYLATCQQYSIDRVIADPEINRTYVDACRKIGVPGRPAEWNHRLVGLRKAAKLKGLPRHKHTSMRITEMDQFLFASEIAWRLLGEQKQASLDDILCDPDWAAEFDKIASRFAPGWTPFHYRWGALRIRKNAKNKRRFAEQLPATLRSRRLSRSPVLPGDLERLPACEGVYLLSAADKNLYLGETCKLRDRIRIQTDRLQDLLVAFNLEDIALADLRIRFVELPHVRGPQRLGLQSRLLGSLHTKPIANAYFDKQAFMP